MGVPKTTTLALRSVTYRTATTEQSQIAAEVMQLLMRAIGSHADLYLGGQPSVSTAFDLAKGSREYVARVNFLARSPAVEGQPKIFLLPDEAQEVLLEAEPLKPLPPDRSHVMIDLETLGRAPGCKVMSLGAVAMTPEGPGPTFYRVFDWKDQEGLLEEPETVQWWSEQDEAARAALFGPTVVRTPTRVALVEFAAWLDTLGPFKHRRIWGNGGDFDAPILAKLYEAAFPNDNPSAPSAQPWNFWNSRCYRLLKNLRRGIELHRQGAHHNALDDARSQADHAVRLLNALDAWADV